MPRDIARNPPPLLRKEMVRHMNRHGWKEHLSKFGPIPNTGSQEKLIGRLGSFWSYRLFPLYLEDGIQDDKNLSKLSAAENQKTPEDSQSLSGSI